jgi:hypothetical protein
LGLRSYTSAEVVKAIHDYAKKIGEGGVAKVYYGQVLDGQELAMKVFHQGFEAGLDCEVWFETEILPLNPKQLFQQVLLFLSWE